MVTADELHAIKKMRGSGYTYREIAEEYNLKPSTVAYQIKKLKGKPEDSFIEMIHASQFTPKETLIEFLKLRRGYFANLLLSPFALPSFEEMERLKDFCCFP